MHKVERTFDMTVPDWNQVPQLKVSGPVSLDGKVVIVPTDAGTLCFSLNKMGLRIQSHNDARDDFSILKQTPAPEVCQLSEDNDMTRVQSGQFELEIDHAPLAFRVFRGGNMLLSTTTDGHFVRRYRLPPMARVDQGWLLSLDLKASEQVYGLGEKWGKLDKRGQLIRSFNHDALGVNAEISYKNTPFCWSPRGWGMFAHTPSPVTHAVGYAPWSQRSYAMLVEDQQLDVFLLFAQTGAEIIDQYTN